MRPELFLLVPLLLGAAPFWDDARQASIDLVDWRTPQWQALVDGAHRVWPEPPPRTHIRLVVEGGTGGVSAPYSDVDVDEQVAAALPEGFARLGGGFGALRTDDGWLLTDGAVRSFDTLAGAPLELDDAAPVDILTTADWAIVVWPPDAAATLLPTLAQQLADPRAPAPRRVTTQGRTGPDGLLHIGPAAPTGAFDPRAHEIRLRVRHEGTVDGVTAQVHVIARARGEGTRRAELARTWSDDGTFHLAAGNSLEGRSFLAGMSLSLQRDVTWQAWRSLGLDVLVPATNELLAGVDGLRDEAAAADVTLVSSNLRDGEGQHPFTPWTVLERGGRRLLVLGWTPPSALAALPPEIRNGLVAHGEESLDAVLGEALTTLEREPDLVVLVGLDGQGLGGRIKGVDLVLTDFAGDPRLVRRVASDLEHLAARRGMRRTARDAALVGHLGPTTLGRVEIEFGGHGEFLELSHTAVPITEELHPDPTLLRAVQDVRQTIYADREDVLVPAPDGLAAPRAWRRSPPRTALDDAAFAALAGNLLAERTGADLALLRPLPAPLRLPGPRPALLVDSSLVVLDEVVVVELTGKELKAVLKALAVSEPQPGATPATDGWVIGANPKGTVVAGRKIADGDLLRLATTDFFTDDPRVSGKLAKARLQARFRSTGWRRPAGPRGAPWALRDLVREGLETLRAEDPTFGAAYARRFVPLLGRDSGWVTRRLAFSIEDLSLGVTGSLGFKPETGYESSNETRATLKDSFATELKGKLGISWSDRFGEVLGFVMGNFARSSEEDADEPIELADDLVAGAEARVRVGAIRGPSGAQLPLSAFLQGAFDTEFTAPDDPAIDSSKLPRQQLLRTTGGVTLGKVAWLKEARAGFFVEADLAAEEGTFSPGFSAGLLTDTRWGPIKWTNVVDFRGHLPTPDDTEADLSIRLDLRTELGVLPLRRILPGLSFGGFVDALLFRGQIEDVNTTPGLHLLLGAQVRYDAVLRPPIPVR